MYNLITHHILSKNVKNSILKVIETSIKINRFLNKDEIMTLINLFNILSSKANVINKQEMILLNRCIIHLNNKNRVNSSLKILRTKKIKSIEIRIKKQNREFFKISRLLEYCSIFLLCILSISE